MIKIEALLRDDSLIDFCKKVTGENNGRCELLTNKSKFTVALQTLAECLPHKNITPGAKIATINKAAVSGSNNGFELHRIYDVLYYDDYSVLFDLIREIAMPAGLAPPDEFLND